MLRDWWRVLLPGGTVSIGVPDAEFPLSAYVNKIDDYFEHCRAQPWCPPWVRTRMDEINCLFPQEGLGFGLEHRYAYDLETLAARLEAAGFVGTTQRPYDPARDSRPGTLWVDARKA